MKLHRGWAAFLATLALVQGSFVIAQQVSPQRLTLREAIELALKNNLSVRVAGTQVDELQGTRERREASLLPRVSGRRHQDPLPLPQLADRRQLRPPPGRGARPPQPLGPCRARPRPARAAVQDHLTWPGW